MCPSDELTTTSPLEAGFTQSAVLGGGGEGQCEGCEGVEL